MPPRTSLTVRTAALASAKTLVFLFSFILPLLLVRRLSQSEFGVYKQIFLFVDSAAALLPFGFTMSAFYFAPREPSRQGEVVLNIFLFNILTGALLCSLLLLRPGLLGVIFKNSDVSQFAGQVGFLVLLSLMAIFLETIAVARQDLRLATILIVVFGLTRSALLMTAAIALSSVRALIWAAIIQGILQTAALLTYLRARLGNFWRRFDWALMRRQLSYALPHGMAGIMFVAFMSIDNYIVSYQLGPAAYAVYAIGLFNIPLVVVLNDSVGQVMISRVSDLQARGESREIIELTARMMRKMAAAYFPLYALLLVVGRELIVLLYTSRYLASWPVFAINATLIPLSLLSIACDPIIRAHFEHRFLMSKLSGSMLLLFIAPIWFGTRYLGLLGAVSTAVALNLITRVIVAVKVARILKVTRHDLHLVSDIWKIAAAALVAGMAAAAARASVAGSPPLIVLTLCTCVAGLIYLLCLMLLQIPSSQEREQAHLAWIAAHRRVAAAMSSLGARDHTE